MLTENAKKILEKRYFVKDNEGKLIEDWDVMCKRVATFVASAEEEKLRAQWAEIFSKHIKALEFLPSSPTLFNAGTDTPQLNACFALEVGDSMEEIFKCVMDSAIIYKSGGGCGFYFGHLRPKDSMVGRHKGISSGPLSFMRVFDETVEVVKQGARRRGAALGCLPIWHPDIEEFVDCKNDKKSFNNFNLSIGITDEFMRCVDKDTPFELRHPKLGIVKKINARKLWNKICKSAHASGDPGILFVDNINKFNPLPKTPILTTNPCGEQPLNHAESCVLGSINLVKFVVDGKVNYDKLAEVVHVGIRFLDNTIDLNKYPTREIETMSKANRKVGLGIMGYADLLIMMNMRYDSEEAVNFADQLMNFINKEAYAASVELGKEKGNFPNFDLSIFSASKSKSHKVTKSLRNATRTTIAPTGTISIIAGCSSGIEPIFSFDYKRESSEGVDLSQMHPLYKEAMEKHSGKLPKNLQDIFVSAGEIDPEWHIKTLHAFQMHTDNAVSKTINLPAKTSIKEVKRIYEWAWKLGLKGITVFRDGCKKGKQVLYHKMQECPQCKKMTLKPGENCWTCQSCGFSKCDLK